MAHASHGLAQYGTACPGLLVISFQRQRLTKNMMYLYIMKEKSILKPFLRSIRLCWRFYSNSVVEHVEGK